MRPGHAVRAPIGAAPGPVGALASPWLMALFFLLMAAAALAVAYEWLAPAPAVLLPLGLLVVNLTASIASNARFRADLPLLVFHVSLLLFVALLATAWLTYFEGATKVLVGGRFGGDLLIEERGALHGDGARALRFANDGFTETYTGKYRHTRNRLRVADAAGGWHDGVIGDDRPLVLDGYRIYASGRGYAAKLQWVADDGAPRAATVLLGALGVDGFSTGTAWSIPGGPSVWVSLSTEPIPSGPDGRRDDLGARQARNQLVLKYDGRFYDVPMGGGLALPGGRLSYVGVGAWMGYRIIYDPTKPWLIGTVAVAVASLLWFYARRLWRTWDED